MEGLERNHVSKHVTIICSFLMLYFILSCRIQFLFIIVWRYPEDQASYSKYPDGNISSLALRLAFTLEN